LRACFKTYGKRKSPSPYMHTHTHNTCAHTTHTHTHKTAQILWHLGFSKLVHPPQLLKSLITMRLDILGEPSYCSFISPFWRTLQDEWLSCESYLTPGFPGHQCVSKPDFAGDVLR